MQHALRMVPSSTPKNITMIPEILQFYFSHIHNFKLIITITRQIIRCRTTTTFQRPQTKQVTAYNKCGC